MLSKVGYRVRRRIWEFECSLRGERVVNTKPIDETPCYVAESREKISWRDLTPYCKRSKVAGYRVGRRRAAYFDSCGFCGPQDNILPPRPGPLGVVFLRYFAYLFGIIMGLASTRDPHARIERDS